MGEKKNFLNRRTFFNETVKKSVSIGAGLFGRFWAARSKVLGANKTETKQNNPYAYNIENLKKIDPNLITYHEINQIKSDFTLLTGIAIDQQNHLFISGDRFIMGLNSEGSSFQKIDVGENVRCIGFGPDNLLYAGLKDRVVVYNPQGKKVQEFPTMGEQAYFTSVAISPESVFAADAGNRVIWRFDHSGTLKGRIGEKDSKRNIPGLIVPSPFLDVAVDKEGFLWVANSGRHALEKYSNDGDLITSWRKPSMRIDGFCGCCNPSHFTLLSDDSFVTSEKGIERIKIHDKNGQFKTVVAGPDQFEEATIGLDLAVDGSDRIYVLDPKKGMVRIFVKEG